MKDCIFCKIISGELDSAKVWEDEKYLAVLDINPNTKGLTLVIPKEHHDSYINDMSDEDYASFFLAAKKVCLLLEKALEVKRVAIVVEGMGVNHAHIKLYPMHGIGERFAETWAKDKIYHDKYQGYLSTQLGPEADMADLKKLAEKIVERSQ